MKIKEIEELVNFINQSGLEEVHIETEEIKLLIKRSKPMVPQHLGATFEPSLSVSSSHVDMLHQKIDAGISTKTNQELDHADNSMTIKSPMIGTFYRSATPDTPPFVLEGQVINPNQTVCIIEAMKLFNEIESEVAGTILKILVEDASPVEYDQPLFLVKPAS